MGPSPVAGRRSKCELSWRSAELDEIPDVCVSLLDVEGDGMGWTRLLAKMEVEVDAGEIDAPEVAKEREEWCEGNELCEWYE